MQLMRTHRPRNVNAARAAGLLYGDWGTSKAYVIGIALVIAGYSSFWPLLAVAVLSLFVGLNYVLVCKFYPRGGGVYASVQGRSKALALIGALFLAADYLVTAALSALAAFHYFGVHDPIFCSALALVVIGALNFLGPKHTGSFALLIAVVSVATFTALAFFCLPFLKEGWHNLQPPTRDPLTFWTQFCSVILALSGVETIANSTAVMKLNRDTSEKHPLVTKTATPALLWVMAEVILYTLLFGLAALSLNNLHPTDNSVTVPGYGQVDNHMLSYMALIFGGKTFGAGFGHLFFRIVSVIVGLILLSATNTAINGLAALQYYMASDGELPKSFQKINRFGVPLLPLLIATVIPILLILLFKKIILLADLYAIGFVGAIAVNLAATSTNRSLAMRLYERLFMSTTALIMVLIELTLFFQKPDARNFAIAVLIVGLSLRLAAKKRKKELLTLPLEPPPEEQKGALLCIVKKLGKAARRAIEESRTNNTPLNIIFVREQSFIVDQDLKKKGIKDKEFRSLLDYIRKNGDPTLTHFYYSVTDSFVEIALAYAERLEATRILIDAPDSKALTLIKGNDLAAVKKQLPLDTQLIAL